MSRQPAQGSFVFGGKPGGKIDHQEVDLASRDQRSAKRPAFSDVCRTKDEKPTQVYAAGNGLQWIEDATQIEERDDPASRLGLRKTVQRERRLAAGPCAAERGANSARQSAGAEKRIQAAETGGHDLIR